MLKHTLNNLQAIYLDFVNNHLTVTAFADHNHLNDHTAQSLIDAGRDAHELLVSQGKIDGTAAPALTMDNSGTFSNLDEVAITFAMNQVFCEIPDDINELQAFNNMLNDSCGQGYYKNPEYVDLDMVEAYNTVHALSVIFKTSVANLVPN